MGHRVLNHEGKCKRLHGHRYRADVTVGCYGLDNLGRVIDFGVLKSVIGGFIDNEWDHKTMLYMNDPYVKLLPYSDLVVVNFNPTAENIVNDLFVRSEAMMVDYGISMERIRLYETPNCYVDYDPKAE